jgi:hypothetical protein
MATAILLKPDSSPLGNPDTLPEIEIFKQTLESICKEFEEIHLQRETVKNILVYAA